MLAEAVLCHFVGDYLIQSNWMANEKTRRWLPAIAHGVTYTLPFALLTRSVPALLVICVTHVLIDHYRLARHVVWVKNQLAPRAYRYSWSDAGPSGYGADAPAWLAVWLMIVADNTMHVLINYAALRWL